VFAREAGGQNPRATHSLGLSADGADGVCTLKHRAPNVRAAMHEIAEVKANSRSPSARRATPLRRRVLGAIVSATVLGVVLFAIPLAVTVQRLYRGQRIAQLQRDAIRVAAVVPDAVADVPRSVTRPTGMSADLQIGVYRLDGHRIGGSGPVISALAASARDGRLHDGNEAGHLAVAAPVPSDGSVQVTVRVATATNDTTEGIVLVWTMIATAAAAAIGVAAFLARRQSRAIALPLERLTTATAALGAGELPEPLPPSGIVEADAAADALQQTAARLDATLRRQRAFSRDVSHQLRTPLTALMLGLEAALARPDADLHETVATAVERLQQFQRIVEELLQLAEPEVAAAVLDFGRLADAVRLRWHGAHAEQGRRLDVRVDPGVPEVRAPEAAVRQILDVLVGNAFEHGAGTVAVVVRRLGDGVAIDVTDEGSGFEFVDATTPVAPPGRSARHGLGLPLARALTHLAGGSLVVENTGPAPALRLLLPASRSVDVGQPPAS
jgi:signal transduction histidine kinase